MRIARMCVCLISAMSLLACGGGSGSNPVGGGGVGGSGGSGGGGGGSGGGSGLTGGCGISSAIGVSSAGPAEGAWAGLFPILFGIDGISGFGVVATDGQAQFLIGDEMWTGSVLASSGGAVASTLTRYRATRGTIGGLKDPGPPNAAFLGFDTATAGSSLAGKYLGVLSNCQPLHLGYSNIYRRPSSLDVLAGVFTTSDEDGYTLTITIHSDGQLDGSDTQGCVLIGDVAVPDPAKNYYNAVADVSSCGTFDAHYAGAMWLSDLGSPDDNAQLNMSISNDSSAIFRRLAR